MENSTKKFLGLAASALLLAGCQAGAATEEDVQVLGTSQLRETAAEKQEERLSMDEAKQIAFDHAGVNGSNARFDDEEFDRDDNLYELEFYVDGVEYEYDIHAETGDILEAERDEHHKKEKSKQKKSDTSKEPKANAKTKTNKKQTTDKNSNNNQLTKEEAVQIALDHAGVSKSEVVFDDVEFEHDDGRKMFEIEFDSSTHEYEYDINAETGKILDHEIEKDD